MSVAIFKKEIFDYEFRMSLSNQVIVKALKKNDMKIMSVHIATNNDVIFRASNTEWLNISIVHHIGVDSDRLTITDESNEDNFAIMYPTKGNNRSLASCMRICLHEIFIHN